MTFSRSIWLGALGAIAALAAVPNTANAGFIAYDSFSGAGLNNSFQDTFLGQSPSIPVYDFRCIPDTSNDAGCGPSAGGAANKVPLGTNALNNANVSGNPLFVEKGTQSTGSGGPWNTFWPTDLKTGGKYTGDVWTSQHIMSDGSGNPVTQIQMTLTSAISGASHGNGLGFVVVPDGIADGSTYTITVNANGTNYVETEMSTGSAIACTQTSGNFNDNITPSPCGFFGFRGNNGTNITGPITISITTDNEFGFCSQGLQVPSAPSTCSNGGLGVGDFVSTISPIPEPTSLALLGGGLLGLGLIRRRFTR